MGRYALRRVILSIPTVVGLTLLVFTLLRVVIPADTVDLILAHEGAADDPDRAERLRRELGLGGPLPLQYLEWAGGLVTGDFGTSSYTKRTVASELAARLPVSTQLGMGALAVTLLLAVPIGLISAVKQDSGWDYGLRGSAILVDAIPGFWLATLILVLGSIWFSWAPPIRYVPFWEDPVANLRILWLPMLLLGIGPAGSTVRLVRTQVLEVLRADYVRTARAKGLGVRPLYVRHVLRNSLIPVVTVVGLRIPALVAGTVIFETIFGIPGVGRYLLDAITRLDYPVILATNVVFGLLLITSNLIVDLSYSFLDPRIHYE